MRTKMLFYRAKAALTKQLARRGLRRSHFLGALTVFAAMTSTSAKSASAIVPVTAASTKAAVSGAVLATVLTKAFIISIAIILALTGTTAIITSVNSPDSSTHPFFIPWPGPGQPQFENRMNFMGVQPRYTFLTEIVASHNPDQDNWRCFVNWPREQDVQLIAVPRDKPRNTLLILEQDHWIEFRIRDPFLDRPGPEIGLFVVYKSGILPSVYLTDGDQQLQKIFVTHYRGSQPPGIMALGFDLSNVKIDFEVRGLRIEGHDREGQFGGCGIFNLFVSLANRISIP